MQKEEKVQKQQAKPVGNDTKKAVLHYLLVYFMCLVAACVTWLLVRYSMRAETQENDLTNESKNMEFFDCAESVDIYV